MKEITMELLMDQDDTEMCENCGNVYRVELLKESDDWNDFGYSHCPFCGNMTDDYASLYEKRRQKNGRENSLSEM